MIQHEMVDCQYNGIRCQFESCSGSFTVFDCRKHFTEKHGYCQAEKLNTSLWSGAILLHNSGHQCLFLEHFEELFQLEIADSSDGNKLHLILWIMGSKANANRFSWSAKVTSSRIRSQMLDYYGEVLSYSEMSRETVIVDNLAFECSKDMLAMYRYRRTEDRQFVVDFEVEIKSKDQLDERYLQPHFATLPYVYHFTFATSCASVMATSTPSAPSLEAIMAPASGLYPPTLQPPQRQHHPPRHRHQVYTQRSRPPQRKHHPQQLQEVPSSTGDLLINGAASRSATQVIHIPQLD